MSSTSAPPAKKIKKQPEITVSPLFPSTSEVDVFVRTRYLAPNVTLCGTNKIFLQAASSVFRDAFQVGHPAETHDSIPIIDVDEHPVDLELFLLHLHPGKLTRPNGDLYQPHTLVCSSRIHHVARVTEKYNAPLVLHSLLSTYLPMFYGPHRDHATDAINALGLALVYNTRFHVRAALCSFERQKPDAFCNDHDDDEDIEEGDPVRRAREFNVWHMDRDILDRISTFHVAEFSRVAGKIGSRYAWSDAARDFRVCTVQLLT